MRHWKKKPWVDSEVRNWDYIADHLAPEATASDAGKVLTVGETGKPVWGEGGGSGGGVLVVHSQYSESTATLDKTWNEIKDALINDILPVVFEISEGDESSDYTVSYITFLQRNPSGYVVNVNTAGVSETYFSENPDGTPTLAD